MIFWDFCCKRTTIEGRSDGSVRLPQNAGEKFFAPRLTKSRGGGIIVVESERAPTRRCPLAEDLE